MASSSGIIVSMSSQASYDDLSIGNISIANVGSTKDIINIDHSPTITGFTGEVGSFIPIDSGLWAVSGSGRFSLKNVGENIYRKNLTDTGNANFSGYINLDFNWETFNGSNITTLASDSSLGYSIKAYTLGGKLIKRYDLDQVSTGFDATGLSGFAGDNASTGYFFTGLSGFAGNTGITGGLTGGTGTGAFTYAHTNGGTGTGLSDMWGLVESGSLTSKNTYIPVSGTGYHSAYGILESGFDITRSGYNTNQFTFPSTDQYDLFLGDDAKFVFEVENYTLDGDPFSSSKVVQILNPRVDSATFNLDKDKITTDISSDSSADFNIQDLSGNSVAKENSTEFIQIPDGRVVNYRIIPEDQFGTGVAFNISDTGGSIINFSNKAVISGLSTKEVNVGTDPGLRVSWDVVDENAGDVINSYYNQYVQVFDPSRDGKTTNPFNPGAEVYLRNDSLSGAVVSGGTGFGHGLRDFTYTGASGFAGLTGYTGDGLNSSLNTGTGNLTYELYNELLYNTGDHTGVYGLIDSGSFIISDLIETPLSANIFNYKEILTTTPESGNIIDISFKDCNTDSNQAGFFLWLTTPSTDEYITGKYITGSTLQDYFISSSGFGLTTTPNYDINVHLGSGNLINSSKASPGAMKLIATDASNEPKDILFANTSGFGTTGSGDISVSFGASNTITSDGAGNIDFTSNTGTGDTQLFNITTDPDLPSIFKTDIEIHMPETGYNTTGYKLFFGSQNQNTDPMFFTRVDTESDDSELRLYLGDNYGDSSNFDKLIIGSSAYPSTDMEPILTVKSVGPSGNVDINANLTVSSDYPYQNIAIIENDHGDGGGLRVATNAPTSTNPALQIVTKAGGSLGTTFSIGNSGNIVIDYDTLPTSDPGSAGQLWRDTNNFLKISPG
jgi:hypothetical protein